MITTDSIDLSTKGHCDVVDITLPLEQHLARSLMSDGLATVFITGSTAGVTTIEYEPGLIADLKDAWQRLVPEDIPYAHNQAWGDGNGHSHVRASLLGASLVIPFHNKKLALGTWQQVVLIDFDNRPRQRKLVVQLMGE